MAEMDNKIDVGLETGKKRVFANALDWPGWSRSGKDEESAMTSLLTYALRYQSVLRDTEIPFWSPAGGSNLAIVERQPGNTTTDFGAPDAIFASDRQPLSQDDLQRYQVILQACWYAFDATVQSTIGKELRKGPRGGGRDLEKIVEHVLNADLAYLSSLGWKSKIEKSNTPEKAFVQTRQEILTALEAARRGELPERGPRGGEYWPVRFYVRRSAWHVLDHTWEMEDRV